MNILYCGDQNIADGVLISVLSILKQVREPLHIYLLTASLQTAEKIFSPLPSSFAAFLRRKAQKFSPENTVERIDASDLFSSQTPKANLATRFTPCCMLRLYADQLPMLPEKILYLDNDVVCRRDFSDFYRQDMTDLELAGVLDHYGKWFFRSRSCRMDYLNSGVLLLNLKKIRETGLFARCRLRCAEKEMFMPDQSAINKLAVRKKICPRRYNEQRKLQKDTVFQHFTTSFRFFPWFHTVSAKPWQVDRMHEILKLHEYDALLEEYGKWKIEYETGVTPNEQNDSHLLRN